MTQNVDRCIISLRQTTKWEFSMTKSTYNFFVVFNGKSFEVSIESRSEAEKARNDYAAKGAEVGQICFFNTEDEGRN